MQFSNQNPLIRSESPRNIRQNTSSEENHYNADIASINMEHFYGNENFKLDLISPMRKDILDLSNWDDLTANETMINSKLIDNFVQKQFEPQIQYHKETSPPRQIHKPTDTNPASKKFKDLDVKNFLKRASNFSPADESHLVPKNGPDMILGEPKNIAHYDTMNEFTVIQHQGNNPNLGEEEDFDFEMSILRALDDPEPSQQDFVKKN
jgi:hypothetical protein